MKESIDRKRVAILVTIPSILLASPLTGYYLGKWIDSSFSAYPLFTYLLLLLGFLAGVRETIRVIRQYGE